MARPCLCRLCRAALAKHQVEEVDLRAYDTVSNVRTSIGKYLAFYNGRRPHSGLDRMTAAEAYFNALMPVLAAA